MEILTTLLWFATVCVLVAVVLNYFVIKSDLKNIKKLMSKIVGGLMLLVIAFTVVLMAASAFENASVILKINQGVLFSIFTIQLVLSIIITNKITTFLSIFINDKERVKEEENAFWCLLIFLVLSTFIFVKYYSI